ncbi:MAG TPA: DUF4136 domain-containing protein [Steroidobacteraceae bacterium]|nr:DUF4136 domain-containing protein [Steroidobacteraceae bacterium]
MLSRFARRFAVALLVLASAAAIGQSISTNYVPGTDFSKFRTYRWVAVEGATAVDQILDQQIKQAVDKQLATKSLTKKDADPVDLYVGYQVAVEQEKELNAFGAPGWRFGGGMASVTTSTVDIGTLVLDIYNPVAKQLLWRGSASETVSTSGSPEKKQERLDKAMAKLLKKFPPAH